MDNAVIFDVDGVLLELTPDEEELFFASFATHLDSTRLSRDWNSYRIRNDSNIIDEIIESNGLSPALKVPLVNQYLSSLQQGLNTQTIVSTPVSGAVAMLDELQGLPVRLGIATANFREAARMRLVAAAMWQPVKNCAHGADGGGHKSEILARAIATINVPKTRIVYIGDNVNDVIAGIENGVNFIGFSTSASRRNQLRDAGASHTSANHQQTLTLTCRIMNI